jgi:hypothetical protein
MLWLSKHFVEGWSCQGHTGERFLPRKQLLLLLLLLLGTRSTKAGAVSVMQWRIAIRRHELVLEGFTHGASLCSVGASCKLLLNQQSITFCLAAASACIVHYACCCSA